jgi:hypothetical protein
VVRAKNKAAAARVAEPQPGRGGPSVACAGERGQEGTKAESLAAAPRPAVVRCGARHLHNIQRSELGALVGDGDDCGVGQLAAVPGRGRRRQEWVMVRAKNKAAAARMRSQAPGDGPMRRVSLTSQSV